MPLTRYQIRNEYSLADPKLYRAADRDDPEALLEGVAMAGLVGVLRQLGDLAEFAAEIFYGLHEEVMVTASRGHGLMIRVQQLEAEFPSIEKALLSQTNHSLFVHNAGTDWHPNLRMDQNLITHGDLPHFVMESYEECQGPPRLFLLDKFDTAGAGACLKRYSDPSFYKTEFAASETMKVEVQKEKKARKIKKKGSRWRNGETLETFPTSHAKPKLHQLFSEERSMSSNNIPARHVKLKRQLNGSTTGKSYMAKFLEIHSPECKVVCESSATSRRLTMRSRGSSELGLEVREIGTETPDKIVLQRERSPIASSNGQETVLEPCINELGEYFVEGGILKKLPDPNTDGEVEKALSTLYDMDDQKKTAMDGKSNTANAEGYISEVTREYVIEGEILKKLPDPNTDGELEKASSKFYGVDDEKKLSVDGGSNIVAGAEAYRSDNITSEIDNYMDALTTMESEMETDAECRSKNKRDFISFGALGMDSDRNENQDFHARFSDSLLIENSSALDDENNSFNQGGSSVSYSDTLSSVAEDMPTDGEVAAKVYPSNEMCLVEIDDISSKKLSRNGDDIGTISPVYSVPNGTCNEVCEIPHHRSEFGVASYNSYLTSTNSTSLHLDPGATLSEVQLVESELNEISSGCVEAGKSSCSEEDGMNLAGDLSYTTNVSGLSLQNRDVFLQTKSADSQPVPVLDDETLDVSSEPLLHQSDVSDLSLDEKNDDDALEVLPEENAESSPTENLISRKLDLSHLVTLETEEQIHGFFEQEVEVSSGIALPPKHLPASTTPYFLDDVEPGSSIAMMDNVIISTGENSKSLFSMIDIRETADFVEQEFQEMTDVIPPLKLDSAEAGIPCSEVEMLREKLEGSLNIFSCEGKDGSTPYMVPLNSLCSMLSDAVSLEFPSDCPKPTSVTEIYSLLNDSVTDNDETVVCSGLISSSPDDFTVADEQKELNQLTVIPTSLNGKLCNPESFDISSSLFLDDVLGSSECEQTQKDLHINDGTVTSTSPKESDQKWESKSLYNIHLPESTEDAISSPTNSYSERVVPLEQSLDNQLSEESLHEDGERLQSSALQCEESHCLNHRDRNGCFEAISGSCQADSLTHTSEAEFSTLAIAATHSTESFEPAMEPLDSNFPHSVLRTESSHQQTLEIPPNRLALAIPLPDHNALHANLEMPPLPPLPPMQWRIGKLLHSLLALEEEMMQHNLNPFSTVLPATADEKAQQEFSTVGEIALAEHLNPLVPLLATGEEKPQHVSETVGGEALQHTLTLCQEPGLVNDEIIQQGFLPLEGKRNEPMNPFLALPDTDDDQRPYSHNLGAEMVRPSLKPFVPLATTGDVNPRHASLSLPENIEQSQLIDAEKLQHTLNSEGEAMSFPSSIAAQPTKEYEQARQGSQISEGEIAGQSNASALLPAVEDGKPNGNYQARHPRPRDPLIEAVASHEKSMLRKVTDWGRPIIGPKEEERDSLLAQIRTKSFNLKPAVVTRPSIQGPKTNLKVVAILEKANAIRQALAGSDEDDEGSWSDS